MSEFDLEAAKRGEAVEINFCDVWCDVHFIGTTKDGLRAVFQFNDGLFSRWPDDKAVRMKPKQREMFIFPYKSDGVIFTSTPCETREEAEIVKRNFPKPAGEVQPILVEE